jgi:hypothetical protein
VSIYCGYQSDLTKFGLTYSYLAPNIGIRCQWTSEKLLDSEQYSLREIKKGRREGRKDGKGIQYPDL